MSSAGWSTALPSDLAGRAQQNTLGMLIPGRASSSHSCPSRVCTWGYNTAWAAKGIAPRCPFAACPHRLPLALYRHCLSNPLCGLDKLPSSLWQRFPRSTVTPVVCSGADDAGSRFMVHAVLEALLSCWQSDQQSTTRSHSHLACPGPRGRACVCHHPLSRALLPYAVC